MGSTITRAALAALLIFTALVTASVAEVERASACGAAGPFDFDTYEPEQYKPVYNKAMELAAAGKAISSVYTVAGEQVDLRYKGLTRGPRTARTTTADPNLVVPPTIFKSITWVESNWANGSNSVPYGGVGPGLRSFDCGYGLAQITSGMSNTTGTPTGKQALVGSHFLFNLAEGVRILAEKWNSSPKYRPIAGTGDPAAIEDWYFSVWGYNGFAFSNHPLNPNLDPLRGEAYHCGDPSAPNYAGFLRGDFTYPELVYGCMRNPPLRDGQKLWPAVTFEMPKFDDPRVAPAFDPRAYFACDEANWEGGCPAMDFPTTLPLPDGKPGVITHKDPTPAPTPDGLWTMLGAPRLAYSGPSRVSLQATGDGTSTTATMTVDNIGAGVAPYRIRTSAPWIVVRHVGDPPDRTLDGGVAVAKDTEVVLVSPTTTRARKAQPGYTATLAIALDPSKMQPGESTGTVWVEPLLGGGASFEVAVTGFKPGHSTPYRNIVPNLAADQSRIR